jgi:hypothetical protein
MEKKILTVNKSLENVAKFVYLETTVTNQIYNHEEIRSSLNCGSLLSNAYQGLFPWG